MAGLFLLIFSAALLAVYAIPTLFYLLVLCLHTLLSLFFDALIFIARMLSDPPSAPK